MDETMSIQSRVKMFLSRTGRKKKWLAEKLGISPATLSQWLAGKSAFTDRRLNEILKIMQENA